MRYAKEADVWPSAWSPEPAIIEDAHQALHVAGRDINAQAGYLAFILAAKDMLEM